ncbi:hypothetical protein BKI52_13485 [marine bacterium AO1-C]|nr:hypothetical protein BKI52_13485 [marine bacterium AO1-C]
MFSNKAGNLMCFARSLAFFALVLLTSSVTLGQTTTIKGRITAKDNGEAVAGASVYISNTTIGSASNGEGFFTLPNVPSIPFVLNISSIGFKTKAINIDPLKDTLLIIALDANVQQLQEVVITPEKNDLWARFGQKFLQDLIGYSKFSRQCKIKNLQSIVLDFDREKQTLTAFCQEPLIILNKALGYRIKYWLEGYEFSFKTNKTFIAGYPFFEDLLSTRTRKRKARRYKRNRSKAYKGSVTHFIQALYAKRLPQEGFQIDFMHRVKVSDAYDQKVKQIDTLAYDDVNIRKIYEALKIKTPSEATAKRYLKFVKDWYLSNSSRQLRLRLGKTNVVVEVFEFDRDRSNPEKIIISNYKIDPSIERRSKQGIVNMIVAQNIDPGKFVQKGTKDTKRFKFTNFLYITYNNEIEEEAYQLAQFPFQNFVRKKQTSIVSIPNQANIMIHPNGYFSPPGNMLIEGYWAFEKIDKLLPLNFTPEK